MTFSHPTPVPGEGSVQIIFPLKSGEKITGSKAVACSKHHLGVYGLPRQSKLEVDWGCSPPCVTARCRDAWLSAYATICGPEDIINQLMNDVIKCVQVGLAAATLSAIFAGPAAAGAAFEVAFKGCLAAVVDQRVNEISIALSVEEESADWGPC